MAAEDSLISFPEMDAHIRTGTSSVFNLAVRVIYFSYTFSRVDCAQLTQGRSEHSVYQPLLSWLDSTPYFGDAGECPGCITTRLMVLK